MTMIHCPTAATLLTSLWLVLACCLSTTNAKEVPPADTTSMKTAKRLKGRKLSDSIYQWRQFEAALASERKKDDSSEDSFKYCEKIRDKHGITCTPSAQPSSQPSISPSVSHAPSVSSAPSLAPSEVPSRLPTQTPSKAPTGEPSVAPSKLPTGQPSVNPTGKPSSTPSSFPTRVPFESMVLFREDGTEWQDNTCVAALPAGATQLQTEETRFEYFLFLKPDADATANMQQVEQSLATAMAEEVLTCQFDGSSDSPFETYGVTSLPVDQIRGEANDCPETVQMDGADCYVIVGGFTPTIFYLQRRGLSFHRSFSSQSQSEIVSVYGPLLQSLLDSNAFVTDDIVKTTYSGFLLGNSQGSSSSGGGGSDNGLPSTFDTTTTVAIQGDGNSNNGNNNDGGGTQTGFVIGAIAICLAIIALIAVSAVLLQRRKDAKRKQDFELCEDDNGQLELDAAVEIDTEALPDKYDTRSVLQEGFPGDNTRYNPHANDIQDVESFASGGFRAGAADESSIEARRAVRGLKYSVVNDEATFDESLFDLDSSAGNDPHDYTNCKSETCFKCRSRKLPQPTFVQADLQAIQSDLGSNKKYRPKYNRQYATDDTVNL